MECIFPTKIPKDWDWEDNMMRAESCNCEDCEDRLNEWEQEYQDYLDYRSQQMYYRHGFYLRSY